MNIKRKCNHCKCILELKKKDIKKKLIYKKGSKKVIKSLKKYTSPVYITKFFEKVLVKEGFWTCQETIFKAPEDIYEYSFKCPCCESTNVIKHAYSPGLLFHNGWEYVKTETTEKVDRGC